MTTNRTRGPVVCRVGRGLRILWRRARRAGLDLDVAAYAAFIAGGTVLLATMTGVLGPTLDAAAHRHLASAEQHAAR